MNAFIIHGAYGDENENWFPWLKRELESQRYTVITPRFPTPEGQSLEAWLRIMHEYQNKIDEKTIMIGHSIGCAFILNVLERSTHPVKAVYLVAGFISLLQNEEVDGINRTFTERTFNWDKIRHNAKSFHLFNSDNDPYVSVQKAEELAQMLRTSTTWIPNAGHFNNKSGYTQFPQLLQAVLNS